MPRSHSFRPQLLPLEDRAVPASMFADFNGDGYDDLAVGMPSWDGPTVPGTGAVLVSFGSADGLRTDNAQFLTQNSLGVDTNESYDWFGTSLAAGDFNGDDLDDLAVGASGEDAWAGAVYVLYGSADGPGAHAAVRWDQDSPNIPGGSEAGDRFGYSLAAGDFNGDDKDDLAIGVPEESFGSGIDQGVVNVLYGTLFGLQFPDNQLWSQSNLGSSPEDNDNFGYSLAAGDFDGNGIDELAIGVPFESVGLTANAGIVHVLVGTASGLTTAVNQIWHQDSVGVLGVVGTGDRFGQALATGDFDGDGKADLAIGVPGEIVSKYAAAGAVSVLYGSPVRLTANNDQLWTAENSRTGGVAFLNDNFGATLAAGDFDGHGTDELVIGTNPGLSSRAGEVTLLAGDSAGLVVTNQFWAGANNTERFGSALSVGDYNGDGKADLTIGIRGRTVGGIAKAGAIRVMYGGTNWLSLLRSQFRTLVSFGFTTKENDGFGDTL